ncbi:MAG: TolC family protein [Bryobacterales bacterium]|nr:TolC family protein [Bryobacterales bacterium]
MKRPFIAFTLFGVVAFAQAPARVTLEEAVNTALKNNPRVSADFLTALAAGEITTQIRSNYYPVISAAMTGVGAAPEGRIAAGALNNPIIISRLGMGGTIGQMLTDFGRTSNLVAASRLREQSQREYVQATRAQVALAVYQAYFTALRTQAVQRVAEQTVQARQVLADQVGALAQAKLKSGLDVTFAEVNLAEAKILAASARNEYQAALATLSSAMGYPRPQPLTLDDVTGAEAPAPQVEALIDEAVGKRPELAAVRLEVEAARRQVKAEQALNRPSVGAYAAFGGAPAHDDRMKGRYAAAGLSITVPVFNGYLFKARQAEADLRAQVVDQRARDLANTIARDVTVSALHVDTAYQNLALTRQLLEQAQLSLDLAQERYKLGLSSFVEVSQAQLNATNAEIRTATAKYDYFAQRALLDYQVGRLR